LINLKQREMKNFKTTFAGILAGIPIAIDALVSAYNQGAFTGKHGMQLAVGIAIVLLGAFAHDAKPSAR
jgi:hypothetical protein